MHAYSLYFKSITLSKEVLPNNLYNMGRTVTEMSGLLPVTMGRQERGFDSKE